MDFFKASVQYGDWEGTSAADDSYPVSLQKYLDSKGLVHPGEFLVGASLYVGENNGGKLGMIRVEAYLYIGSDFDTVKKSLANHNGQIPVRPVAVSLTLEEFVGLFKRFDVIFTRKGLDLEGREYVRV